jgi:ADP-ribosylglycohydrolase
MSPKRSFSSFSGKTLLWTPGTDIIISVTPPKFKDMSHRNFVKDALLGVATGDALGVPVEFMSRNQLKLEPVRDMRGYGTYNQPAGTWSDDSSMTFCLAESLTLGYNLKDIANQFVRWCEERYWTPHGKLFDIGNTTCIAIDRLRNGYEPNRSGSNDERSNGNGSLMRILPLAFYLLDKDMDTRFRVVKEVSAITHAHLCSVLGCFIYIEFAISLIKQRDKWAAYQVAKSQVLDYLDQKGINPSEVFKYHRILVEDISKYTESQISGSGYVVHSLEAALWCLLRNDSYSDTVLAAVNLGQDTDTTGAITGGLAALLYGWEDIPKGWLDKLARHNDIVELSERLSRAILRAMFKSNSGHHHQP